MPEREELAAFYKSFKARAPGDCGRLTHLVGPDLIWIDDDFLAASPRIAVIGQQIDGWDYSYPEFVASWDVTAAIEATRGFDFALEYRSSPFWQFFHAVRRAQFGSDSSRRTMLWANLIKFATDERKSLLWESYREEALRLQDDVLKAELAIARPDICIFVTGPDYDDVLRRYYPEVAFSEVGLPVRTLARLSHPLLPAGSYRSYHPKAMRIHKHWDETMNALREQLGWA